MNTSEEKEIRWGFTFIFRWLGIIVGCTLAAAVIASLIVVFVPPSYEAIAMLLIEPSPALMTNDYSSIIAGEQLAYTYSHLMVEQQILQSVINQTGIVEKPEKLARRINAEPVSDTQLIQLEVRDQSPQTAALLAETIIDEFLTYIKSMEEERYGQPLNKLQDEVDDKYEQIQESQKKIDALNAESIEQGIKIAQLQSLADGYHGEYQLHQQSYLSTQLASNQLAEKIQIVETEDVKENSYATGYSATITLLIDPSLIIGEGSYSTITNSGRVVSTYGQIWTSKLYMEAALDKLGMDRDPEDLANNVSIESISNTQLVELRVDDPSAEEAQLLANTIGEVIVSGMQIQLAKPYQDRMATIQSKIDELSSKIEQTQAEIMSTSTKLAMTETELLKEETVQSQISQDHQALLQELAQLQLDASQASNSIVTVTKPQIPSKPTQDRLMYIILATMIGLMVGTGAAFVLDQLDETIKTRQDVIQRLGFKLLGSIEAIQTGETDLATTSQPRSKTAEDFSSLGINLCFANSQNPNRTLLVSSPGISEGKSLVTANLAIAMAKLGQKIVVVDADLRLPRLHELFDVPQENGLSEALVSGKIVESLKDIKETGIRILTSGNLPENPAELLSSGKLTPLLDKLSKQADLVLIDCPPVLTPADTMILASATDGVMLVLRAGTTSRRMTKEAEENLRQIGANLVGVVLNGAPRYHNSYYRYYKKEEKPRLISSINKSLPLVAKIPWFKKK